MLESTFHRSPQPTKRIESPHRRIVTPLPAPETLAELRAAERRYPQVNCYQPPAVWDRADGYQVFDAAGNCWIDFTSGAVFANTGHGHPRIRAALAAHVESGLLGQFSFASAIRAELAERLVKLAPPGMDKVYFWTVGSEAIEAAFRVVREWGRRRNPRKVHLLAFAGDFHGWTLAAHQLSGQSADKPWLPQGDPAIHHLPFPRVTNDAANDATDWQARFDRDIAQLENRGVLPDDVAGVFIETLQGWGALPLARPYVGALRAWADQHQVLLIFDEIQTGFGRTGKLFGHEHYGVRPDLIAVGKGLTSGLPLAVVLGSAEVLDVLPPGEITTTHAGHPLSCAAALANLDVLEEEHLIEAAASKGELARDELGKLQSRFADHISEVSGLGLLNAIHFRSPQTGEPDRELARDATLAGVSHGVMLFQTNQPTLKVCPPLVIPPDALVEGIGALGEAIAEVLD